jgi:hypothetical protein
MRYKAYLLVTFLLSLVCFILGCGGGGGGSNSSGNSSTVQLVSMSVSPSNPKMLQGGTLQMKVLGTYSDNTTKDISTYTNIVWRTANAAIATVSSGRSVTGVGAGTTTISASIEGVSGSTSVTVYSVTDRLVLYFVTSADTSQYFSQYHILVESEAQTLIRYVPELNLADVVTQNKSYSYAPSDIYPYTTDNRLFIRKDVRPYEYSGSHSFVEYNPRTHQQILNFNISDPNSATQGNSAILGASYYYRVNRNYEPLIGYTGGEFRRFPISNNATGDGTTLLNNSDVDNSMGNLQASNGILYDAYYYYDDTTPANSYYYLYKRNLSTGKIDYAASKRFAVTDAAQYAKSIQFAFEGNIAYWVRLNMANSQIEIWKHDFSNAAPSQLYSGIVPGISTVGFSYVDVSGGYVVVAGPLASQSILIYNAFNNTNSLVNLGLGFYGLQVLHIE